MSALEAEIPVRSVEATINYVAHGSFVNRRFVAPGVEHNTGRYEAHIVPVRDGWPIRDRFTLDAHGFTLARHRSEVRDFFDREEVDRVYEDEVVAEVKRLTGATRVLPMGWMTRTSGDVAGRQTVQAGYTHRGGVQPPAGEAHVDFTPERAERMAAIRYRQAFPDGPGYTRFICSSFWRAFSEPPHDVPLAVCEAASLRADEGTPNSLFIVDRLPDPEAMVGPIPGEDEAPAAAIFHYSPDHRWWYFSGMSRDDALLIKFHDSDRSRAWRAAHTAFRDPSFPNASTRCSVEFRTLAYFE